MRPWLDPPETPLPADLAAEVGGHPLVAQTLLRRGLTRLPEIRAFLDPNQATPTPASELPDLLVAAGRLEQAIQRGERICVWGDFDVDGQTATTLLVSALRDLGAQVSYHIPVRETESHGIRLPVLEQVLDAGAELILTCDTGVSAVEEVKYACQRGVDVIISDHHDLPEELPPALALVNPKRLPASHPLAHLPGVGVAYKLAEELYWHAGRPEEIEKQLDLAALGIVADLAILQGEARYLLQRGLQALRQTRRAGVQAMMELAELQADVLTAEHIAFKLAPRMNALGRLADANLAVELLTTQDLARARVLALQLEGWNERRKLLTSQVLAGALAQIEADPTRLAPAALVLAYPAWPAGVLGIVASRLVERYAKPVVLLTRAPDGSARGSARSVEGVNITAAIATQAKLLAGFGGHPMAAGLALPPGEDIEGRLAQFRRGLAQAVLEQLGEAPAKPALQIDAYLPLAQLSLELVDDLERLAPFGPGNPPLTLASTGLLIKSSAVVGRNEGHLAVTVVDEGGLECRLIWWQGQGIPLPVGRFDLAYHVRASTYAGERNLQVEWVEARQVEGAGEVTLQRAPKAEVLDFRQEAHKEAVLERLRQEAPLQVWCEGEARQQVQGSRRQELEPGPALAIWTSPPGPNELKDALERVSPTRLYLFGVDPQVAGTEAFLARLAGLIKYELNRHAGRLEVSALAAAMAHRELAVRLGIAWWEARGALRVRSQLGDEIWVQGVSAPESAVLPELNVHLNALLEETAAYRAFFRGAEKDVFLVK
ncbi:MAG: single-stranded-DNA-specific exonuclease RecJ [Anaerolineales bacterium]|nr:single-stranded-DNA-specific exonuclease RecJ [Anaerolineales bacterium]